MDKDALYESLVEQYHADIFRYLRWMLGDATLAEDLTQDTYVRAWKYLDKLEDPNKAKAWLYQIARNEIGRKFERKYHPTVSLDDVGDPMDGAATPDAVLGHEQLVSAVESLDPLYRDPLLLQLIAGLDGNEIAQVMGIERATVTTRIFRAKRKVQALCVR